MKDKIRFDYIEAQVEITCVLCNTTFTDFPDFDKSTFNCPKCDRQYSFLYSIEPMNNQKILKKKINNNLMGPIDTQRGLDN